MSRLYARLVSLADRQPVRDLVLLFVRIALGAIFWRSGRTKVEEGSLFEISDTTYTLFRNDYSSVPLPADLAAVAATAGEHVLPIMLLLGLGTRFAAAGLIAMTLVIQLFVYPLAWWSVHMSWIAMGLVLLTQGSGRIALAPAISRKMAR
ncbi:DoxX family protein [Sphingomicrobium nitratireducens]|uniref:DoxX family protein n=1 Tax=Sphingomicrobium nitratireducens TaxID=2964666 RepID=UPI00223EDB33|nr:DoxX family protein [Sphingomicrobium nitratireducens]